MNIVKMTDTCRNESLQNLLHAGLPMPYGQMCAKAPESVQGGQCSPLLVKQEQQKTLKTRVRGIHPVSIHGCFDGKSEWKGFDEGNIPLRERNRWVIPSRSLGRFQRKISCQSPTRAFPYCNPFAQRGEYLRTVDDPEAGTNPCPGQITLDYLSDEEIDACEDDSKGLKNATTNMTI